MQLLKLMSDEQFFSCNATVLRLCPCEIFDALLSCMMRMMTADVVIVVDNDYLCEAKRTFNTVLLGLTKN